MRVGHRALRGAAVIAGALTVAACTRAPDPTPQPPRTTPAVTRQVTVLFVADLHGQLESHPELFSDGATERVELAGGFARLASAIEAVRAERPGAVLVVDGGDTLQGSGAAALTEGAAVVQAIAPLGIDVGVPGNWEVAYGPDALRARASELGHPLVASNLRDAATGEREFAPYVVRDVGGVRVAIVGFTDPDVPRRQPPAYSEGLRYEDHAGLPAVVDEARRASGADVVLLASHVGLPKAVAMTPQVPGIDVHPRPVHVIACGDAIEAVLQGADAEPRIQAAVDGGVRVLACGMTLDEKGIDPGRVSPSVRVVANGLVEAVRLQDAGYVSVEL